MAVFREESRRKAMFANMARRLTGSPVYRNTRARLISSKPRQVTSRKFKRTTSRPSPFYPVLARRATKATPLKYATLKSHVLAVLKKKRVKLPKVSLKKMHQAYTNTTLKGYIKISELARRHIPHHVRKHGASIAREIDMPSAAIKAEYLIKHALT